MFSPLDIDLFVPGYCAYLDVENAMDPSLAESTGELLISRPESAENMLRIVDATNFFGSDHIL